MPLSFTDNKAYPLQISLLKNSFLKEEKKFPLSLIGLLGVRTRRCAYRLKAPHFLW